MIGLRHFAHLIPTWQPEFVGNIRSIYEHIAIYCILLLQIQVLAKSAESHFSHHLPFFDANQVGLGIGYRYGRSYSLSFAQITLELTVVVPTSAGRGAISKGLQMIPDGFEVLQT